MAKKKQAKETAAAGADVSSQAEKVGFHKGALTTLAKEREEMMKVLTIVEQLMQMHIKALKEMGIDLAEQAKKMQEKKKLEETLK